MATTKKTSAKTLISMEETLYRFIMDDYDHHAILESAVVAIAKKRAKQPFPKELAVRVMVPVVTNAKYWYDKTVKKLPPLRCEVRDTVAFHLYDTEESHIKRLTSYYKQINKQNKN